MNVYWCWRGRNCHETKKPVCARDVQLKQAHWFPDECSVFKFNCNEHTDYLLTNEKACKGDTVRVITTTAEENVSKYNCYRLKSCDRSVAQPVCGYDEGDETIAKFENECTLFKVNCNGRGRVLFKIVDDNICETKVIKKTTTPTTTTGSTIDYYDFGQYSTTESTTHYWQDPDMLREWVSPGDSVEPVLREGPTKYNFPANLMTLIVRH